MNHPRKQRIVNGVQKENHRQRIKKSIMRGAENFIYFITQGDHHPLNSSFQCTPPLLLISAFHFHHLSE